VIVYEIPAITDVHLAIYNSSGQELATVADGTFQPGIYTAQIDAMALGQGIHYCLLKAGRFTRTLTFEVVK
jgi:hypothetical protein